MSYIVHEFRWLYISVIVQIEPPGNFGPSKIGVSGAYTIIA